jgi:hypothetical protein
MSPGDSLSALPGFSSNKFSAVANTRSEIAVLDNDLDNDGNYDAIADPLAMLALGSAALVVAVGVVTLVGIKLLLILCEAPKLFPIWPQVSEHPG